MDSKFVADFMPGANPSERRAAALRAEQERADQRRRELESQSAPTSDPRERILIWERLHGLQLPKSAQHPLVEIIAKETNLTTRSIQEEQERRRGGQQSRSD